MLVDRGKNKVTSFKIANDDCSRIAGPLGTVRFDRDAHMNNSRERKRMYPSDVLRATCVSRMRRRMFFKPTSDRREGRRVVSLFLVCAVPRAVLRVRCPVCSEGLKVGILVVSVIHTQQTCWNATDTLLDRGTRIVRPRTRTEKKSIPCPQRFMNLRCCSLCLKILLIIPWLSYL
jgi:hypothetical protein